MQKVRYCLSFNSFNTKFQNLLNLTKKLFFRFKLFTFSSHYSALSMLSYKTLEIDFPFFKHLSTLSILL